MSLPAIHRYIGRIIHLIRREKGMRQSELALLTGLKQPNLSRIENGLVSPRHGTLEKIAKALGVEVQVFYSDSKVQEVERKWAASMGPKHAALLLSGKLVAVPLIQLVENRPLPLDASGHLTYSRQELMLQFPPDEELIETQPFAVRIPDDAMSHTGDAEHFPAGDLAIFGRTEVKSGDFVLAVLKEFNLFRRALLIDKDRIKLAPLNPTVSPHVAARTEIRQMFRLLKHLRKI